ncbi:MAG: hypothetical protein A2Y23_09355 [Clostridiales bacterium GWB2_37_7]|nr:MAG: hypothetical protein A2Y23_09355 [Clostridiales bacterium GWB2_37_7]
MLFDTNMGAAVRCTNCGKMIMKEISLFQLSRSGVYEIKCDCGRTIMTVRSSNCKSFRIHIPCIVCEKDHLYMFDSRQALTQKVKILSCPASQMDIAFVGNKIMVQEMAQKHEKDLQELIEVLEI